MDSKQKLEINLKAAKLCGIQVFPAELLNKAALVNKYDKLFDIFSRSDDREATVIALGEKHAIALEPCPSPDKTKWCYVQRTGDGIYEMGKACGTYTEALAAAVEAIDASA